MALKLLFSRGLIILMEPSQVFETEIHQAWKLIKNGTDPQLIQEGLEILKNVAAQNSGSSKIWFEYAGAFDFLGREGEALPLYEKIFKLGVGTLPLEDQPRLYIQTGSTLRNLRRLDEARAVLQEGLKRFPQSQALKVFLALTEHTSGNSSSAVRLLIDCLLETSSDASISDYQKALRFYSENFNQSPWASLESRTQSSCFGS